MWGHIIVIILLCIVASRWLKWKILTLSIIYYLEKNQYKQPDQRELKVCTDFVVRNMIRDLIGH